MAGHAPEMVANGGSHRVHTLRDRVLVDLHQGANIVPAADLHDVPVRDPLGVAKTGEIVPKGVKPVRREIQGNQEPAIGVKKTGHLVVDDLGCLGGSGCTLAELVHDLRREGNGPEPGGRLRAVLDVPGPSGLAGVCPADVYMIIENAIGKKSANLSASKRSEGSELDGKTEIVVLGFLDHQGDFPIGGDERPGRDLLRKRDAEGSAREEKADGRGQKTVDIPDGLRSKAIGNQGADKELDLLRAEDSDPDPGDGGEALRRGKITAYRVVGERGLFGRDEALDGLTDGEIRNGMDRRDQRGEAFSLFFCFCGYGLIVLFTICVFIQIDTDAIRAGGEFARGGHYVSLRKVFKRLRTDWHSSSVQSMRAAYKARRTGEESAVDLLAIASAITGSDD